MLVFKEKFEKGDVVTIKLVNGTELMAFYEFDNSKNWIVSYPLEITGVDSFSSWITMGDTKRIVINKDHVLAITRSLEIWANHYKDRTKE